MTESPASLVRFAADDGEMLRVQVTGRGRPVILLHEWAADHRVWRPFAGGWGDGLAIHAWDARGHGGTAPERPATVERMALDLANMIDHFAMEAPVVIGHSMGALTLWQYIAQAGCDRLGAICIIDQTPRLTTAEDWDLGIYGDFPAERNRRFLEGLAVDFPATVLALIADGSNERARRQIAADSEGIRRLRHRLEQLDPAPLIACWASLSAADFRPVLPRITVPALLVYGARSNYYGPAVADYVHAAIPDSRLYLYENADHSPHQGHRQRFLDDLRSFMAATLKH